MQQQYRPQSFRILPPVIKNLLIINVLLYLLSFALASQGIDLTDILGLHFPESEKFRPYQIVTYMFMHAFIDPGGEIIISHIFFNMFALWMFGNVLENFWGSKRFLIFYMATGIGAALIYMGYLGIQYFQLHAAIDIFIANPSPESYLELMRNHFGSFLNISSVNNNIQTFVAEWSGHVSEPRYLDIGLSYINELLQAKVNIPMVGASGAVFGVLLAFGMLFPNTELYLMFIPIPIKAKFAVILYGVIELVSGIAQISGDNVAHFAHLGGMLFGFILIKYWQKKSNRFY
jgi:membrane associated rhomboid family serine protease